VDVDASGPFHPSVGGWFSDTFPGPTEAQVRGWPAIAARRHALIAAPTGSGKTLAAFLASIDALVREGIDRGGELPDETRILYVSPLKALSNDVERNLREPLRGIQTRLEAAGLDRLRITVGLRTGDTTQSQRRSMVKRPPHIVVTTPESLYILLTSAGGRRMLETTRTVIVDEIHALVANRRGAHLSLTLERLQSLCKQRLTRVGLSATQKPIEDVSRYLVGARDEPCEIIDSGLRRDLDVGIELPASPLEAVMPNEVWSEIYDRIAELAASRRTTLVFVNTRRLAERAAANLGERLGADQVLAHHGSLARDQRHRAEQRLKNGELRCLVATASLELGIDIGAVDLVVQLGSTRTIAAFLQRVGRSQHHVGGTPCGRIFPLSRDELVEATAMLRCVQAGELDRLCPQDHPLDILAQQVVASAAAREEPVDEDALLDSFRLAYPYRELSRAQFDAVLGVLSDGYSTHRGRRGAHLHRDRVNGTVKARRGARLAAITSGGAIPELADYDVVLEPTGTRIGSINEDFAIESVPGDIFQLGTSSWRILKVEPGKVRVADAKGQPPTLPFWLGEAPARSTELSGAVSALREDVAAVIARSDDPVSARAAIGDFLSSIEGVPESAAIQLSEYLGLSHLALGELPTQRNIVVERFFDEGGGMQLVLHAPFGARLNRAWGLALRKCFCRSFNFELQAAATEDAIVLSLGPTHSFPLDDVFNFLHSSSVRDILVQALLDAPMFTTRWRWNCTRALAVLRFRGGKKVAPPLQRMQADDLLGTVFPDQAACLENIVGDREVPDDPIVQQTIDDCLFEAMDIDGLEALLREIEAGTRNVMGRDLTEPSPLAHEVLNARPYAFLDDAPLEERRTQAVLARRWLDPDDAASLGKLDTEAIDTVREQAWPTVRDADELHEALFVLGAATEAEVAGWAEFLPRLIADGRAALATLPPGPSGAPLRRWVVPERLPLLSTIHGDIATEPPLRVPAAIQATEEPDEAMLELVRARLDAVGPATASQIADAIGRSAAVRGSDVETALIGLESKGIVLRGRFDPRLPDPDAEDRSVRDPSRPQWCERGLLARINRYTLKKLRREIEPVSARDYMRFLMRWQRMVPEMRAEGDDGLLATVELLEGFGAAAGAWETELLTARLGDYDPRSLDALCLSGHVTWGRIGGRAAGTGGARGRGGPVRSTPIAILPRATAHAWRVFAAAPDVQALSSDARTVLETLKRDGASFFDEFAGRSGLLRTRVETALAELAAAGLVVSDGFSGLRALLLPADRRQRRTRRVGIASVHAAGRWSAVPQPQQEPDPEERRQAIEVVARVLLRRYGVVFRTVLERERWLPPWRELLRCYRRLEARGEIRGGRFVSRFSGEQFALPEAVGALRAARRAELTGALIPVSGSDPLNLLGIIVPGERVASIASNRVLFRDGEAIAKLEGGEVQTLAELGGADAWDVHNRLLRGSMTR
jgi:ATP-dependent Lhr-like helicase